MLVKHVVEVLYFRGLDSINVLNSCPPVMRVFCVFHRNIYVRP